MKKQYDVVIIGAGVVGSAIARELSRYKLSIAVLEKNLDVCNETSGRNSAVVHGGFANPIGSLKAKCCVEGNRIMDYRRLVCSCGCCYRLLRQLYLNKKIP